MARPFVMHNGCRAASVVWLFCPGYLFLLYGSLRKKLFCQVFMGNFKL